MNKALAIFGGTVLVLILGFAGFFFYFSRIGPGLDASSKAYVDSVVPVIVNTWSVEALEKRASPQFLKLANHDQTVMLFRKLSQLGALKRYHGAQGDSNISYTTKDGKVISAKYLARATFQNGDAEIRVFLIQIENEWRILGFFVNSPIFLK
jgi:hypothetical protein